MATQNVTLTYTSTNPPGTQFTFSTPQPFLFIDVETTVIVTLQNATFVTGEGKQVTWISGSFPPTPNGDHQISIDVTAAPPHFFAPWVLSFNVNVDGANGVSSPTFSLTLSPETPASGETPASTSINLQYAINTGIFTLAAASLLANLNILTNNITPLDVTFNLLADSTVTFDPTKPILGPDWLPTLSNSNRSLTISIPATPPKFASFRFVLDVGSLPVTSPDPIIVNATIGDGT
jgi:hypothetical protein